MKTTSSFLRRAALVLLPATLLLSACGKDDEPIAPVVDQGRVNFFHAAASANVQVKALVDDAEKGALTYGQSSGYQGINTGSRVVKVNVASSGAAAFAPQTINVEKDKSYSYFAYASAANAVSGLLVPDDLTAPTSGKAKIRLVHLGVDSPASLKLSTTAAAISDIPNTGAAFGAASPFVEIQPGQYNVAVTSGTSSATVVNVGDGSGSGAGTNKTYEAGKIYTIVVRGINSQLVATDLQTKAVLIQNN